MTLPCALLYSLCCHWRRRLWHCYSPSRNVFSRWFFFIFHFSNASVATTELSLVIWFFMDNIVFFSFSVTHISSFFFLFCRITWFVRNKKKKNCQKEHSFVNSKSILKTKQIIPKEKPCHYSNTENVKSFYVEIDVFLN